MKEGEKEGRAREEGREGREGVGRGSEEGRDRTA